MIQLLTYEAQDSRFTLFRFVSEFPKIGAYQNVYSIIYIYVGRFEAVYILYIALVFSPRIKNCAIMYYMYYTSIESSFKDYCRPSYNFNFIKGTL